MYHHEQLQEIEKNILYQMKDYSYDFKGDTFSLDIIDDDKTKEIFTIYHSDDGLSAYFKIPSKGPYLLQILYDKEKYQIIYKKALKKIFVVSIIVFVLLFLLSIGFAFYSLRPMREAIYLLEEFLKDLIHDLNTPATSILLNAKLLKRRGEFDEVERIELCAKGISSLYKNLELITPSSISNNEQVFLNELIVQRIELLEKIYPSIVFTINTETLIIKSNQNAIERILDNLLTNACKYNIKKGKVTVDIRDKKLYISDTGIGIKNTKKVFQRYYKENESGLGIGLNIVKQLCDILDISIKIKSKVGEGTIVELEFVE